MFIESLFNFPRTEVSRLPENHFRVAIPIGVFKEHAVKIKDVFWKHFETVNLLQRTKFRKKLVLIILYRHELPEAEWTEEVKKVAELLQQN
jgi:hypothetical protein